MKWVKDVVWSEWVDDNQIVVPKNVYPVLNIEGPDCGGKTSIINILLDIIKHSFLLHTSAPTKGSTKEYFEEILHKSTELIELLNQPILIDRFHIGESVYGSIFRGYELDFTIFEEKLLKQNMKNIYITARNEVLVERMRKRGDWYVKEEDLATITSKYEEKLSKSILPTYVLDTSDNIKPEDIKKLIEFIYS